jgi:endoglucanase
MAEVADNSVKPPRKLWVDLDNYAARQAAEWKDSRPVDAALMERIGRTPQAVWIGDWPGSKPSDTEAKARKAADAGEVFAVVVYNIAGRDSGGYSAGGAATEAHYKTWIAGHAAAFAATKAEAIVILEPDALPQLQNLSADDQAKRLECLRYAAGCLKDAGVTVYQDAGHSNWHPAEEMARRLQGANADLVDGFALNVSNTQPMSKLVPFADEMRAFLQGAHYVIDTSRNGRDEVISEWCNPPDRLLGPEPTFETGIAGCDAFLWVKRPGESDGQRNGGPPAGQFWPDYALGLAQRTWGS